MGRPSRAIGFGPRLPETSGRRATDQFNESRINTVIVAAITSNLRLAAAPGNLFLHRTETGLPRDSVLNVSQLLTIDKSLFEQPIGALTGHSIASMNAGLRLVLGL